jgi:hypothetical protein
LFLDSVIASGLSSIPGDGVGSGADRRAVLREAVLSGPGLGAGQGLEVGEREGLLAGLVSGALVAAALARAGHRDRRVRALPGPVVLVLLLALVLHSREGYHSVLAKTMPHLRAGTSGPGVVPSAAAFSRARARVGEDPGRYLFQAHAAAAPDLGAGTLFHGMEVTAFDGTCLELAREHALIDAFGAPTGALRPQARVVTLGRCSDRRILAAAIGAYTTSEQELVDRLADALRPGTVNLADRNFFSMRRFVAFAACGAHLLWRVKNGAKSVPARILQRLSDGSYLVRLRESPGMLTRRRKQSGQRSAAPLPDTIARVIEFEVAVTSGRGKPRISRIRLITTLLDHKSFPARELAGLYAERWQIEITYLRIKSSLRGNGATLRGHREDLVRQEIWALLTVYNMMCDLATNAAALDGIDPDEICFATVLRLTRAHLGADLPRPHCGHRTDDPVNALTSAIATSPRNRTHRNRTSPRTPHERETGHTRKATYTITITEANLPQADKNP